MVKDLKDPSRRLILFGETHDDDVVQEVERLVYDKVAAGLAADERRIKLHLALEFLDADSRALVAAFNEGEGQNDAEALFRTEAEAKKYAPLAMLAKAHNNHVIAANASRRHVRQVSVHGVNSLNELPEEEKEKLPPLPLPPPSEPYSSILRDFMGFSPNKIEAQNLWDVAMANSCLKHINEHTKAAVFLVCGRFHIQHYMGIVDHVMVTHKLEREQYRLIVCLPIDEQSFAMCKDPSFSFEQAPEALKTFADFVVLTKQKVAVEEDQKQTQTERQETCPY
ncbi:hypothetical protein TrRE_jg8246 [Triparma retinervis]|uniref:Haem-binding uptake Tiki superfamily ChaN domain-containing protein n=1 Tax=Triparma retinervis TaxID=2557542 RepID=A0A9W7FW23_9STRA|nr:hypothetical protein TrRE_jg8246 [Triparma retinervis]